ncbi:MAG: type III-A CRISPR-associated RAMP protein Csm5, partial [Phototrophicales bacterium]
MQKPKNYQLVVETLSPLHIGTGQTLQKDFDYVVYRGRTYVVDVDRLSDEIFEAGGANLDRLLQGQPAAQLLSDEDYRRDDYFRYVLEGEPRATSKGAEIQTCIKNAWDYPYIPGSSLKGAVRTAILYNIFEREELKIHVDDLGRKPKFAAQRLEEMAFGKDPNHDWLRCLHFSDSEPIEREYLQLLNVNVFAKGKP